jgi:hypothetical protein
VVLDLVRCLVVLGSVNDVKEMSRKEEEKQLTGCRHFIIDWVCTFIRRLIELSDMIEGGTKSIP